MDGPAFEASLKAFSLWQPVISNSPPQKEGLLFGYELQTLRPLLFHPFTLDTESITCLMEGARGQGKSATLKILFAILTALRSNEINEDGSRAYFRGRSLSRKSSKTSVGEDGEYQPEFEPLAQATRQPMFRLGAGAGINLLSIFSQETDIIEFVLAAIEMELNVNPGPDITNVIMVGVNTMVRTVQEGQISLPVLNNILSELTFEAEEAYHKDYREKVAKRFELQSADLKPTVPGLRMDAVRQVKPEHIRRSSEQRFYEAKERAMHCIHQILEGDYGGAFNGTTDMFDMLSRRVQHIDLEALTSKGQALFEMAMLRALSNAIINSKQNIGGGRNLLKTIPNVLAGDEEGIAVKNTAHLRALALYMIRQRSFPTADFRSIQFGSQLLMAGEANSEARGLALEIEQGFGYRMIFGQKRQKKTLDRYRELNLPDPYVELIPDLKPGQMILWVKDKEPVVARVLVPKSMWPLIQTDAARFVNTTVSREEESREFTERMDKLRPEGTLFRREDQQ